MTTKSKPRAALSPRAEEVLRKSGVIARAEAPAAPAASNASAVDLLHALNNAFASFRESNESRLNEIEQRGSADVVTAEKVDRINAAVGEMQAAVDALNARLTATEDNGGDGGDLASFATPAAYRKAFSQWFRRGGGESREEDMRAMLEGTPMAAITGATGETGGALAPVEWDRSLMSELRDMVVMRQLASTMTMSVGAFEKLFPVGTPASGWVGEADARTETTTPTFKSDTFAAEEQYAMPGISQKMLDDALIDIEGWLNGEVAAQFAETEEAAFISGDGDDKPFGLLDYITGGASATKHPFGAIGLVNSGAAAALTYAGLVDLVHALPSAYAKNAALTMNRLTMGALRKLVDLEGRPIWQPSTQAGIPSTALGHPVHELALPNIAAGTNPVAFGDFKRGYLIIDRLGIRILRDPYTSKGKVLFYTTKRVAGGVQDPKAFRVLEIAA